MSSTIAIPRGIETINDSPEISRYYANNNLPYENKEQIFSEILIQIRYKGQTFNINNEEWWFKEGIENQDLEKKINPSFQDVLEVDRVSTISPIIPEATEPGAAINKGQAKELFVGKEGDEIIKGIKTFEESPIVPVPVLENQAVNKGYLDSQIETADKHFTWEQTTPSDHWICVHNLDKKVSVTITDSANTVVEGQVLINDGTTVEIKFNAPFWGYAHFN